MTVVACADTMTYTLCIQWLLLSEELLTSDMYHLLISGMGVQIGILCESDGCHCKLPVNR